jgi:hypothetical protein
MPPPPLLFSNSQDSVMVGEVERWAAEGDQGQRRVSQSKESNASAGIVTV